MEDAIGKWALGEEMVNLAMNDTLIQKYGWCATTDAATVHGEPNMVYSAMRPTQPAPLLLKFATGSSRRGGAGCKSASAWVCSTLDPELAVNA